MTRDLILFYFFMTRVNAFLLAPHHFPLPSLGSRFGSPYRARRGEL